MEGRPALTSEDFALEQMMQVRFCRLIKNLNVVVVF